MTANERRLGEIWCLLNVHQFPVELQPLYDALEGGHEERLSALFGLFFQGCHDSGSKVWLERCDQGLNPGTGEPRSLTHVPQNPVERRATDAEQAPKPGD
jgi:hypothetical protein